MKNNHKSFSILIPDGETTLLSNVVYSLSLIKGVKIFVLSAHKGKFFSYSTDNSCFKYSRLIDKFIHCPNTKDIEWLNKIDTIVDKYNIDLIMPIFDISTLYILKESHNLRNRAKLCLLSDKSNFEKALRKDLLYEFLILKSLPCPKSKVIDLELNYDRLDLDFPLIAKPAFGYNGGMGVKLIKDDKQLLNYLNLKKTDTAILLQEFIEGYDVTCNVLCQKGEIQAYTMQRSVVERDLKVTPQYEFRFFHDENLLKLMKDLMNGLNWSGVANLDFRFDRRDKSYKVIEINPRFWLNTEASALAGVNFPYLYCLSTLNETIDFKPIKNGSFLHLKALAIRLQTNPFFIFKINFLLKNTPFKFVVKDPLVLWCKFLWRTNNIISSKILKKKTS
jgi:D-aspartate ligase